MVDITAPAEGSANWAGPLNTALEALEAAVTAAEADLATKLDATATAADSDKLGGVNALLYQTAAQASAAYAAKNGLGTVQAPAGLVATGAVGASQAGIFNAGDPTLQALIAKMAPGQTANGFEVQDSAGGVRIWGDAAGDLHAQNLTPAWIAYIPSLGGITLGNGTLTAAYRKIGKTLIFRVSLGVGSTTSFSGTQTLTLPAGLVVPAAGESMVPAKFFVGGSNWLGYCLFPGGSNTGTLNAPPNSSTATQAPVTATSPGTWGNGHNWVVEGTVEVQ